MPANPPRLPLVDAVKALASQFIVLHHLAFYGPMSDVAAQLLRAPIEWFSRDARIAVQAFLVTGGFLAAQRLAPQGVLLAARPLALAWNRYLNLVAPYLAALALAIVAAALARQVMANPSVPAAPTLTQILAHALLAQDILGMDALSAGIWYIAIDFQLFALLLAILWGARRLGPGVRLGPVLVAGCGAASLFYFNRDTAWDVWAPYFFAAYGLGALSFWASAPGGARRWLGAIAAIAVAALLLDFRGRIAVALCIALALGAARRGGVMETWPRSALLAFLARISYSVFLIHYPVCLVANALLFRLAPDSPAANLLGMVLAWAASIAAGTLFHHRVEKPARALVRRTTPSAIAPHPAQSTSR